MTLLIRQSLLDIDARRSACRIQSSHRADDQAKHRADHERPHREAEGKRCRERDAGAEEETKKNTGHRADDTDNERFDKKHLLNLPSGRTNRAHDTNLPGALRNGDQHGVRDANTSYPSRQCGDDNHKDLYLAEQRANGSNVIRLRKTDHLIAGLCQRHLNRRNRVEALLDSGFGGGQIGRAIHLGIESDIAPRGWQERDRYREEVVVHTTVAKQRVGQARENAGDLQREGLRADLGKRENDLIAKMQSILVGGARADYELWLRTGKRAALRECQIVYGEKVRRGRGDRAHQWMLRAIAEGDTDRLGAAVVDVDGGRAHDMRRGCHGKEIRVIEDGKIMKAEIRLAANGELDRALPADLRLINHRLLEGGAHTTGYDHQQNAEHDANGGKQRP